MTKKVWVEAELIDEEDCQVKIGGSYAYTTSRHIHDIPEPVELPKWIADILEDTDDEKYNQNFKRPYIKLDDIVYGKVHPMDLDTTQEKFLKYIHSEQLDIDEAIKKVMYAIVTGNYAIKKEPKYYVLNTKGHLVIRKYDGGISEMKTSSTTRPEQYSDKSAIRLTEEEIKDFDERYFQFAVPVEEVESE